MTTNPTETSQPSNHLDDPAGVVVPMPRRTSDADPAPSQAVPKPKKPSAAEVRACLDKVFFPSEAVALEAVARRQARGLVEKQQYAYPCKFCPGFHVSSSAKGTSVELVLVGEMDPSTLLTPEQANRISKREHFKARRKHHRALRKQAVFAKERDNALDAVLPRPHVASPEEIEAFFGNHTR